MALDIISIRGAVFTLWGVPAKEDMDRIVDALEAAVRECGHPVIYVTRVPVNQPPPSSEVRGYLDELMPTITAAVSSYHVVLEGVGFAAALKRGVLTGLFQLSWRRKTFFVHSVVGEVPLGLERSLANTAYQLIEVAKVKGMLDADGPAASPLIKHGGRAA